VPDAVLTAAPALTAAGIDVHYGEVQALAGVDVVCPRGGSVAILGANAAGKSSLLKALAGLLPCAGDITLLGGSLSRADHADRLRAGVCLVPEQRQVFPNISVEDNLLLGGYRSKAGRKERAADLERMFDLFPALARRRGISAGLLSGGEQQMLAIARGLMARPKVLLMDEPTLGLAPGIAETIAQTILDLSKELEGIVIAEQNAAWALGLCPQVYVLEQGRVVLEGTREEVTADARLRRAFLGA
jgi:ABC-type branched-subunit amino acid transport system ATPase component